MQTFLMVLGAGVVIYALFFRGRLPAALDLSVEEAQRRIALNPKLQVLDVRTGMEHRGGHLPQAIHIPLQELGARLKELDQSRPVLVYCRSGHRSAMALYVLLRADFNATHMKPGFLGWEAAGLPAEK